MIKKVALFTYLILIIFSCQRQTSESGTEEDLLSTLSQFNSAFAEGDLDYLDKHTANNYRHTNSAGKAFNKDSWFQYLKGRKDEIDSGKLKMETYKMSETEVQLHKNAALVTGKVETKGTNRDVAFHRYIRVTHFWVFEGGLWKRAGFHDTRIE